MDKKIKEEAKKISMDDLEKVTGGSLTNTVEKEPKPISPDIQQNI